MAATQQKALEVLEVLGILRFAILATWLFLTAQAPLRMIFEAFPAAAAEAVPGYPVLEIQELYVVGAPEIQFRGRRALIVFALKGRRRHARCKMMERKYNSQKASRRSRGPTAEAFVGSCCFERKEKERKEWMPA